MSALDRIETAGYARRIWDQKDRRTVRVEVTPKARKEIEVLYGPLAKDGAHLLQAYSTPELAAVLRYLEHGRELQRNHSTKFGETEDGRDPVDVLVC